MQDPGKKNPLPKPASFSWQLRPPILQHSLSFWSIEQLLAVCCGSFRGRPVKTSCLLVELAHSTSTVS
jgi:hypothetical protein